MGLDQPVLPQRSEVMVPLAIVITVLVMAEILNGYSPKATDLGESCDLRFPQPVSVATVANGSSCRRRVPPFGCAVSIPYSLWETVNLDLSLAGS
jgi:hypothetical protein